MVRSRRVKKAKNGMQKKLMEEMVSALPETRQAEKKRPARNPRGSWARHACKPDWSTKKGQATGGLELTPGMG